MGDSIPEIVIGGSHGQVEDQVEGLVKGSVLIVGVLPGVEPITELSPLPVALV